MDEAPRFPFYPNGEGGMVEVPITTLRAGGRNWPCGGGGFFRLLPYALSRWAISRVNTTERKPTMFYFHPWEVDARAAARAEPAVQITLSSLYQPGEDAWPPCPVIE